MSSLTHPLVSVVTPFFNEEKDLAECIESILAQTYQNWELILVNNCSTDRSHEIAQRYGARDSRMHVYSNERFLRAVENQNNAIRKISKDSRYCKVVLADDWIFPECLERMVALAEANPSVGLVGAYGIRGSLVTWHGLPYPSTVVAGREICRWTLLGRPYVFGTQTSTLIRSDLIRARPTFYNESNIHADSEVCFEILKNSDFGFVHQVLTYTRMRDGSLTSFSERVNSYMPEILNELLRFGPALLTSEELHARVSHHLSEYYRFLADAAFRFKGQEFWQYHINKLKESGTPLSRTRLMKSVAVKGLDCLFNPKRTIEGLLEGIRGSSSVSR